MILVPSVREKNVCVLFESCSSSRLSGEKRNKTFEFREDISRKDVCYIDGRVLFRVRVYRVDFTESPCARLMWFGICVVGTA